MALLSRVGGSDTRETEELVKKELLQTDKNSDSRRIEEDGQEAFKKSMFRFEKQLILDVLLNLRLREIIFFLERAPVFFFLLSSGRFPLCFAIFLCYSSLLHLLSLIKSHLDVVPIPIRPEYMFRIDRTAIALSGLYFILGSHVSCWYLALGLFALSNAVHIINLIAPEEAGRLAREIISLCSTTCIPNSREIIKGEELVKEQAKMEDEPPMSIFDQEVPEKENDVGHGDDGGCSEIDQAEECLRTATLLMAFEQILALFVFIYVTGSLTAWRSAIFFCLNILCVYYFPIEPYLLFIDRVSSALLCVFFFTGSLLQGSLATGLFILSNVVCIRNDIRKEQGKNIGLCSKTCSLNPSKSGKGEDDRGQEAAEDKENKCWDFLDETWMEILNIKQKLDNNDLKTARTENERDKEYLEETEFNETREEIYEEDEGFWDFLAYKTWLEILINDEQVHNPGSELLEPVAMAELTKEVLGLQSEYNQKLEEDKKKDHMAMFQTLAAATEANSEHIWHCYEKHNAETSGFLTLLQYYEQRCRKLEKENSDLLAASEHDQGVLYNYERHCHRWKEEKQDLMAKLNAADSAAEHDQGVLYNYERHCRRWKEEKQDLMAKLNAADSAAEHDQGVLYNYERHCRRWEEEKQDLMAKLNAADSASEHDQGVLYNYEQHCRRWEEEKQDLMAKLNAANSASEHNQNVLYNYEQHCQRWEEEKQDLMAKLNATDSASEHDQGVLYNYEQHCRRWKEEKQDLMAKLNAAYSASEHSQIVLHDYERQCRRWEEEKQDLMAKLNAADSASEHDQGVLYNYERHFRRWEEEKQDLMAKLHAASSASEHDQVVLHDYERQCRKWEEEKADLNAKLTALTSVYQVCLEGAHAYDQGMWDKERNMLKAQNAELAAKLNGATSSIESIYKCVQELEENGWDLTASLSSATEHSELYRSLLHNL